MQHSSKRAFAFAIVFTKNNLPPPLGSCLGNDVFARVRVHEIHKTNQCERAESDRRTRIYVRGPDATARSIASAICIHGRVKNNNPEGYIFQVPAGCVLVRVCLRVKSGRRHIIPVQRIVSKTLLVCV